MVLLYDQKDNDDKSSMILPCCSKIQQAHFVWCITSGTVSVSPRVTEKQTQTYLHANLMTFMGKD